MVFRDDADRQAFLDLIGRCDELFGLEVHAYCLMGNHFHLLVRSREASLSEAMKWVMSLFTKEANARRGADGAIFRGRFHSVRVEQEAHLDWLFRYINSNPLDLGWELPLADYPWSGMGVSCGRRSSSWLRTDYVRSRFGHDSARFEQFVEAAVTEAALDRRLHRGSVRPDAKSVEAAAQMARAPGPEIHSDHDVRCVAAVVAAQGGCHLDELFPDDPSDADRRRRLRRMSARLEARPDLAAFAARVAGMLTLPGTSGDIGCLTPIVQVGTSGV